MAFSSFSSIHSLVNKGAVVNTYPITIGNQSPINSYFTYSSNPVTINSSNAPGVNSKYYGTYTTSQSSYAVESNNQVANVIFSQNRLKTDTFWTTNDAGPSTIYWSCGFGGSGGSPGTYNTNPYTLTGSYQGGNPPSTTTNYWTTTYTGSSGTATSAGEWVQIQLPYRYKMQSYYHISRNADITGRTPSQYVILGSNDGSSWFLVDSVSSADTSVGQSHTTTGTYCNQFYSYFRYVIQALNNGNTATEASWTILGVRI